ncbi:MAG: homogentisate 1,2-dioxygenase [Bdellovibrionaceae bacterium]|nr:homogentisate 1,2-dioxygenase [Pseudobdellovibrionaceae bacterium]
MHSYSQGKFTKQAHKGIPENSYEEEQGLKGFFGPVSHLIKSKPSTNWSKIEGPLKPRAFDLTLLADKKDEQLLLYNQQVRISSLVCKPSKEKQQIANRSADGDLLFFCQSGSGKILTEYGLLEYSAGTYIVIPKCISYVIFPKEVSWFLSIENLNSHYQQPDRGLLGRNAIYDIDQLGKPNLEELYIFLKEKQIEIKQIKIKHQQEHTNFFYEENIFNVTGWKGDLFPFTLSVYDLMPVMSHRVHLPPSVHSTFIAKDFVVCTFVPRPMESDKDALKVPFYHQNIDYDEVLFYHKGDFFSRDNIKPGMLTFHPAGFPHGPHPKAVKAVLDKKLTDEYAVMVDSAFPLQRADAIKAVENKEYQNSWKSRN